MNSSTSAGNTWRSTDAAGPGGDVMDAESGLDADDRFEARTVGARVDVALDAGTRERGGQLAYVHIHPTSIARSGLGEGGSVERKNR